MTHYIFVIIHHLWEGFRLELLEYLKPCNKKNQYYFTLLLCSYVGGDEKSSSIKEAYKNESYQKKKEHECPVRQEVFYDKESKE